MHHKTAKSDRPAPPAPVKGKAYCAGCSDSSDAALLVMTSLATPIVAPFDLVAPRVEVAIAAIAPASFVSVDRPPSAPPPKA
jgi:hypothetical protein